jgi:Tol biopolymer transport system component
MSDRDGNPEVYLADSDSEKKQRVTETNISEFNPVLSADGRKLAYFSQEDSFYGIWVYSLENHNKKLLSITRAYPKDLQFSPDGLILSYLEAGGGRNDLYIINTADGFKQRVSSSTYNYSWSPDSSSIVYVLNLSDNIVNSEITTRTFGEDGRLEESNTLFVGGVAPFFNFDGSRIYFFDASSEFITLASTSLRGEGYLDEFQIRIHPSQGTIYRSIKNPVGNKLLLMILSNDRIAETLYIALDDKVALPITNKVTAVAWDNVGGIIFAEKDENGHSQIWKKNDYETQSVMLTNNHSNWF